MAEAPFPSSAKPMLNEAASAGFYVLPYDRLKTCPVHS